MDNIEKAIAAYRYAFAFWTDRADFIIDQSADLQMDKLLEIRCFDERGEYHAVRDLPGKPFSEREIAADGAGAVCGDGAFQDADYADGSFDEAQYLDIDAKTTAAKNDGRTYATGGGSYRLPDDAKDKAMISVRYYYRFDEDGIAHKYDWRLVGFTNEETVGEGDQ